MADKKGTHKSRGRARTPLPDRSTKGHSPEVRFGSSAYLRQSEAILSEFPFPRTALSPVLDEANEALFWYLTKRESSGESTSPAEELPYLREFLSAAERARDVLARMSHTTRGKIFHKSTVADRVNPGSTALESYLGDAIRSANNALAETKKENKGGAPTVDDLRALLNRLAAIWFRYVPDAPAITRSGQRPRYGGGEYEGRLIAFVEAVLDSEGVDFTSRRALAENIYRLQSDARTKVALASARNRPVARSARLPSLESILEPRKRRRSGRAKARK